MLDRQVALRTDVVPAAGTDVVGAVREIAARELAPIVQKIDAEGYYPESVLRAFGQAGAFASHLPGEAGSTDPVTSIRAMAVRLGLPVVGVVGRAVMADLRGETGQGRAAAAWSPSMRR